MTTEREHPTMNDQQINDMVSRFLAWRLPEDFNPDGGISFAPTYNTWGGGTARAEPVGTNLFSFDQAKQMVLHMLGEANSPAPEYAAMGEAALREAAAVAEACERQNYARVTDSEHHSHYRAGLQSAGQAIAAAILALIPKGATE